MNLFAGCELLPATRALPAMGSEWGLGGVGHAILV
jgi:hypothetical protein